jgi:hypothetical protein
VHPAFRPDEFFGAVVARFPELELKARIDWIATCLQEHLPPDFRRAVGVLVRSLPAPGRPDPLGRATSATSSTPPYAEYVARHGCTAEDLEFSLSGLRKITTRFSAEYAEKKIVYERGIHRRPERGTAFRLSFGNFEALVLATAAQTSSDFNAVAGPRGAAGLRAAAAPAP